MDPDDMQGGMRDGRKIKYGFSTAAPAGERLRRAAIDDAYVCRLVCTRTPQSSVSDQNPRFFSEKYVDVSRCRRYRLGRY